MENNISEFTKHDWAHMHDCILHCTWETTKKKSTQAELEELFKRLPKDLQGEAYEWGMNDTLWRDHFIEWYEENEMNK